MQGNPNSSKSNRIETPLSPNRYPNLSLNNHRQDGQTYQEPLGSPHHPHGFSLPSCCRDRGLLLAQDLLGLPHTNTGPRGETIPNPPNHQFSIRGGSVRHGMAPTLARRVLRSSKPRVPPGLPPSHHLGRCPHLPGHQRRHLLLYWPFGVFLGL